MIEESVATSSSGITNDLFDRRIIVIAGGFGSGKSEVAVNLAIALAGHSDSAVALADLDLVNPYFRSREAGEYLETLGVRTINPIGGQFHADLPIVLPEIKGAIERSEGRLIIDAGGDDAGARVLATFSDVMPVGDCDMLLVLNRSRPFSSDVDGCLKLMSEIEQASRLKFTGIISNTHLIEHTTPAVIIEGMKLARELSERTKIPILFAAVTADMAEQIDLDSPDMLGVPLLKINRRLLKPWERESQ